MIRVRRLPAATVAAAVEAGMGSTSAGETYVDIFANNVEDARSTVGSILQALPDQERRDALDPLVRRLGVAAAVGEAQRYVSTVDENGRRLGA